MSSNVNTNTQAPGPDGQVYNGAAGSPTSLAKAQLEANSAEERRRIRANATSLYDGEWENLDNAVFGPLRESLVFEQALVNAGLTHEVEYWQTESIWGVRGAMTDAEHTMDLRDTSEEDIQQYAKMGILLPLSVKDYRIGDRELQKSRNTGQSLETDMADEAGRQVGELVNDTILYGAPDLQVTNPRGRMLELPGLLNADETLDFTGASWATGTNATTDLNAVKRELRSEAGVYSNDGYWLLVGDLVDGYLDNDYDADGQNDVRSRIERLDHISNVMHVPQIPAGEAILLKPDPRHFDLARLPGGPLNIQWTTHGGMEHHFKVYHLVAPRIKPDINGNVGIAHITGLE